MRIQHSKSFKTLTIRIFKTVTCMGGGDINDNNIRHNITVDIKVVLFSLTNAVVILILLISFEIHLYCALLHLLVMYVAVLSICYHQRCR